jgi:hypothetical protein
MRKLSPRSSSPGKHRLAPRSATPRRPWWRAILDDTRGTATTETVIMIPVFAMVWGCIHYVTVHFAATHEMRSRLRRDTWAYAYTACEDEPDTPTDYTESRGLLPDPENTHGEVEGAGGGGALAGIDNFLSYIPGLNFTTLFGERDDFHTPRPAILGGGQMELAADITILCNERPQGVLSAIFDLVRSAFGF